VFSGKPVRSRKRSTPPSAASRSTMHGAAGRAIPQHRGLALIRDADRGDVARGELRLGERRAHAGAGVAPDLERIVLDPPRLREVLLVFTLRARNDLPVVIEDDRAGRCGALVEREDVIGHAASCRRGSILTRSSASPGRLWG
jgi:hypothetical protein